MTKTMIRKAKIEGVETPKLVKISDKLYIPENFEDNHNYYADSLGKRRYWGITTVLNVIAKPALIAWASNFNTETLKEKSMKFMDLLFPLALNETFAEALVVLPDVLEEARVAHATKKDSAGKEGTDVHEEIEKLIKISLTLNGKLEAYAVNDTMLPQVKEFVQWAIINNVKFLGSEVKLYSEKLWVAGTCDFIAEIGGKLMIGDIKTNNSGIYPENFLQGTAYAHMAREMGLYKDFKGVVIVNVPKRGGIKVQENYDLIGNFKAFKCALGLHKFKESQKIKKIK